MEELPLKNLFSQLQKAGLAIGLSEYQLLLKALQGGYGLQSRSELKQLCQMLWAKSSEEKSLLNYHFDQMIMQIPDNNPESNIQPWLEVITKIITITASLLLGISSTAALAHYAKKYAKLPEPPVLVQPSPNDSSAIKYDKNFKLLWWITFGIISIGTSAGIAWLIDKLILKQLQASPKQPSPQNLSNITPTIDDEIVAAQASQSIASQSLATYFLLNGDYLPITQRQMSRSWRYLSRPIREGVPTELDIDATIQQMSHYGILLNPVLVPPRVNRAALLIMIDHDGSMIPFHSLAERLILTAKRGSRLGQLGVYYFHNCPGSDWQSSEDYLLYSDISNPGSAHSISNVLARFTSPQLGVLIISDAGAARGGYNSYRIEQTQSFLKILKQRVRNLAWINPLPRSRWLDTTAAAIAEDIPMFEANRLGIDTAISVLRGKNRRT